MPWGAAAAAAVIGGSIIQGNKAASAANAAAQAQREAAQQSAEMARFRPVGISNRFGTSRFGFDEAGNLSSAGYTPSSELLDLQNFYAGKSLAGRADTERLLSLGRGYISESPQEAQARFYQQQRTLLAPEEEQTLGRIRSNLLTTGRGGLAVGQGGPMAAANPELQAYYNAVTRRQLELAYDAEQRAKDQITFGQGLLSSAYSPVSTPYSQVAALEQLAQSPLDIGAQLGGRSAAAGANAGQLLLSGNLRASQTQQAANSWSPFGTALQGLGSSYMGGMSGGGAGANPFNRYGSGLFDWGRAPTSSSGFESWESPYIQR